MSLRSPLARVRHLGSAKQGSGHWWSQRLSALALIPLVLWFAASLSAMAGADYVTVRAWIGSPVVASLLLLLIVATFYHAWLGVQVVVEDYVHNEALKILTLLFVRAAAILLGLAGVLSVLIILFRG